MTKRQRQDILDIYSRAISSRGIEIHIKATDEPVYKILEKVHKTQLVKDPRWKQTRIKV